MPTSPDHGAVSPSPDHGAMSPSPDDGAVSPSPDHGALPTSPDQDVFAMRWGKAFGRFWWDFLVGDTPELFVAMLVILGVTVVLAKEVSTTAAWVMMPVLVIAALVGSVLRGRRAG